jgi:hypothetical protein
MNMTKLALSGLILASAAHSALDIRGTVQSPTGTTLDSVTILSKWEQITTMTGSEGSFRLFDGTTSLGSRSRLSGFSVMVGAKDLRIASPVGSQLEILSMDGRTISSFDASEGASVSLGHLAAGQYSVRVRSAGIVQSSSFSWQGGKLVANLSTVSSQVHSVAARVTAEGDTTVTFYRKGYFPKDTVLNSVDSNLVIKLEPYTTNSSCATAGAIALAISSSCHLAKGTYSLQGLTFLDSGVVLSIDPGTVIKGAVDGSGTKIVSALIARPGSRLYAIGTATEPIVFTAGTAEPVPGDFGGVVILGRSHENFPGDTAAIEGLNSIYYGGGTPRLDDNSGEIRYARIEYAGYVIGKDNELNSLTWGGAGSKTKTSYVQAYRGLDDAFEWFGGSNSAHHLVSTATDDDMFDFDAGWSGHLQFAFGAAGATNNDANGIEADNNGEAVQELSPRTNPKVYNLTLVGNGGAYGANRSLSGMRLRRGFAGELGNILITGGFQNGVAVDGNASYRLVLNDSLKARGVFVSGVSARNFHPSKILAGLALPGLDSAAVIDSVKKVVTTHWMAADSAAMATVAHGVTAASPKPKVVIPGSVAVPAGFAAAHYIGAFSPSATKLWHEGWTLPLPAPAP